MCLNGSSLTWTRRDLSPYYSVARRKYCRKQYLYIGCVSRHGHGMVSSNRCILNFERSVLYHITVCTRQSQVGLPSIISITSSTVLQALVSYLERLS